MNIKCHVDRFVPKLVADRLLLEANNNNLSKLGSLLDVIVKCVNEKYDVSYTTLKKTEGPVPEGLSHHLVLSDTHRRIHGRLIVIYGAQQQPTVEHDGLILTFA